MCKQVVRDEHFTQSKQWTLLADPVFFGCRLLSLYVFKKIGRHLLIYDASECDTDTSLLKFTKIKAIVFIIYIMCMYVPCVWIMEIKYCPRKNKEYFRKITFQSVINPNTAIDLLPISKILINCYQNMYSWHNCFSQLILSKMKNW